MGGQAAKKVYQYYVPPAKEVPDWYKHFNFVLIESLEDLYKVFENVEPKRYYMGFDTETTGLDFEQLDLVGYSFCLDGKTTYYVPIYHFEYEHNLGEPAVEFIYKKMCEAKMVFMYNARYDMRVFEFRGYKANKDKLKDKRFKYVKYDMSKVNYFDVAVPVWLADTNKKLPSLKFSSEWFLGFKQMHFDEVVEGAGNFFYLNPSENPNVAYYAGADALCTFLLVPATIKFFKESQLAGKIDNKVLYPLMHYEEEKIWIDEKLVKEYTEQAKKLVAQYEHDVYDAVGYEFNLNSTAQVGMAFSRLGIDTGETTATGKMSTSIKTLEKLPQETKDKFPALKSYVAYREVFKILSTYLKVLNEACDNGGFLRCAYKTSEVPTGRLSAGKDSKNTYFSPINIQCVTGDSTVFTKHGIKSMLDVTVGDSVWDGESFNTVTHKYDNGIKKVYRVTLKNGQYLDCTNEHMFYSATDRVAFKRLEDLQVGDLVAFNYKPMSQQPTVQTLETVQRDKPVGGIYSRQFVIPTNNPRFWHMVGVWIGDGWFAKQYKDSYYGLGMIFNSNEMESLEYVKDTLDELNFPYKIKKASIRKSENETPLYRIMINSVSISDLFISLGLRPRAENKKLPNIAFSLNSECRAMLLRGLMDSDGTSIRNNEWLYKTVSSELAYGIKDLLITLGINSDVIKRKNGSSRDVYTVSILGNKDRAYQIIGVTSKYKLRHVDLENGHIVCNLRHGGNSSKTPKCLFTPILENGLENTKIGAKSYVRKSGERVYYRKKKVNLHWDLFVGKLDSFDFNVFWIPITKIEYLGEKPVYDITVENTHRYCVNGFITHNSLPKPHVAMDDVFFLGDRTLFNKKDNILAGYQFVPSKYDDNGNHIVPTDSRYIGQAEGMNQSLNIRSCITPKMYKDSDENEFIYCSCDYSAEELRVVSNLSREPLWMDAFIHGRDVHESTAKSIWGAEKYNRDYRKKAKTANFGIVYGMSAKTFYENPIFGFKSMEEAENFYDKFKKALPTLFQWEDRVQRRGMKKGYVQTYFGRPRRLKSYYDTHNFAFANRTAVNTMVQGCLTKNVPILTDKGYIPIWKLYKEFKDCEKNDKPFDYKVYDGIEWNDFFPVYRGLYKITPIKLINGITLDCDSRHMVKCVNDKGIIEFKNIFEILSHKDTYKICLDKSMKDKCDKYTNLYHSNIIKIVSERLFKYNQVNLNEITKDTKIKNKIIDLLSNKEISLIDFNKILNLYNIAYNKCYHKDINYTDYAFSSLDTIDTTKDITDKTYTLCVLNHRHQFVSNGIISKNTSGDILKIVLCRLWNKLFNNPKYINDVKWLVTIHDEIGYSIRATKLNEIVKIIEDNQSIRLPEWPVPIITEPGIGWSMGHVYDFHNVQDDSEVGFHLEPDLE